MTQNIQILNYLKAGKSLTAIEALNRFGCFRLAARIQNLKDDGNNIMTQFVTLKKSKKRIASYSLKV